MNILVVAATEFEMEPFINQKKSDVLITGVGFLQQYIILPKNYVRKIMILSYRQALPAFSGSLKKGKVVLINKDCFADVGIYEKGESTLCLMQDLLKNEIPFYRRLAGKSR